MELDRRTYQALELGDEVVHTHDTVDVTGIITEEDTTEGSKGTHHVGLPGDWRLNARVGDSVRHGD